MFRNYSNLRTGRAARSGPVCGGGEPQKALSRTIVARKRSDSLSEPSNEDAWPRRRASDARFGPEIVLERGASTLLRGRRVVLREGHMGTPVRVDRDATCPSGVPRRRLGAGRLRARGRRAATRRERTGWCLLARLATVTTDIARAPPVSAPRGPSGSLGSRDPNRAAVARANPRCAHVRARTPRGTAHGHGATAHGGIRDARGRCDSRRQATRRGARWRANGGVLAWRPSDRERASRIARVAHRAVRWPWLATFASWTLSVSYASAQNTSAPALRARPQRDCAGQVMVHQSKSESATPDFLSSSLKKTRSPIASVILGHP